jgi:hypothetical protein
MNKGNMVHIPNRIGFCLRRNNVICDSMDEIGEHYIKWNKPNIER